jgi:hypothetical protein
MLLEPHIERVQDDLRAAASLGGADLAPAVDLLANAIDASLRLAMIDALSVAASELSAAIAPGSVVVQLEDGAPRLVAHGTAAAPHAPHAPAEIPDVVDESPGTNDDEVARISLRLGSSTKRQVDEAAARDGVSVNNWITRVLVRELRGGDPPPSRTTRNRMQGWAY